MENVTPVIPASSPTGFVSSAADFPSLPTVANAHACLIHSRPQLASLIPVSATCSLPRASYWNVRCSCLFSSLPDDLLLCNVFTFLTTSELCQLRSVCSRWKFLSVDPLLWHTLDLSKHSKNITDAVLETQVQRTAPHLCTLKLCNCNNLSLEAMRRLGAQLSENNEGKLTELHLCNLKNAELSALSAIISPSVGRSLRTLSLFGAVNVDDECVKLIRRRCPNLQDLSLRGCTKITDAAFVDADEDEDEGALDDPTSPSLLEVNDDAEFAAAASPNAPIEELVSPTSDRIDSVRVPWFSSNESYSRRSSFSSITSRSHARRRFNGTFAHLQGLNLANLKLLSEGGLIAAFRSCPRLRRLNLHGCQATDAMIDVLTSYCPELEQLHLSSPNLFRGNLALTDAGIHFIATRLLKLQQLNLQGSSQLTDAALPLLIANLAQLERLNLGGCVRMSDRAVKCITQQSLPAHATPFESKLTHLSLFQLGHLTDASVEAIAQYLPSLQHLDLHSCGSLTDAALDSLLDRDVVPAETSDEHTNANASAVVHPLPSLLSLDVSSCRRITADAVAQFRSARPTLTVTHF